MAFVPWACRTDYSREQMGGSNGGAPVVSSVSIGAKGHISLFQRLQQEQRLSKWWIRPQKQDRKVWWAGGQEGGQPQHTPHPTQPSPRNALSSGAPLPTLLPGDGDPGQANPTGLWFPGEGPHLVSPFLPQPWTRWPNPPRKPSTRLLTRPLRLSQVLGKN